MKALALTSFTATSAIGRGCAETLAALRAQRSGLAPCRFDSVTLDMYVGEVPGIDAAPLPPALAEFECRNNRLALLGLAQDGFAEAVARSAARYGRERIGVFLGTSTSGILETEQAFRQREPVSGALPADFRYRGAHNTFSLAAFARQALGLTGPAAVISCACSSSAKVFASAQRAIAAGVIDAAVVGGVDSLCRTTLYGFYSLQLVSARPCRPFDVARDGLSIGEAAAFALLERPGASLEADAVLLLGTGESSDAYHDPGAATRRTRRAADAQALTDGLTARHRTTSTRRHSHAGQRRCRGAGGGAGARYPAARQLYQRCHRACAGRCRRTGSGDLRTGAAASADARGPQHADGRPGARGELPQRQLHRRAGASHEQLVRIRRLQLQPDLRARRGCDMRPLAAWVEGIGLLGPGLADWPAAARVLRAEHTWQSSPTQLPLPQGLPPAERRRTGDVVKLALAVGLEAAASAGADPAMLPAVFTSSEEHGRTVTSCAWRLHPG
jgi:3-oxoacyl-(acyl-carrier-protein) synthase